MHVERIPRLAPPKYDLPEEIKALLGDAKYGQSVGKPIRERGSFPGGRSRPLRSMNFQFSPRVAAIVTMMSALQVSTAPVDEAMVKHMELLHPAVAELAELEYRAQTTWLGLRVRFGR